MNYSESSTLLTVRMRPVVAASLLIVGAVFLLILLDGLFFKIAFPNTLHGAFKLGLWVLLVIAVVTTLVGVKQLIRPAKIFTVTRDGVVQYVRAGIPLERGQLIPWNRMESMELTEASGYHGRRSRTIVVAIKVYVDDEWPKEQLYNFDEASGRVFLDAFSGKPAGKALLEELVKLRASNQIPAQAAAAD